MVKGYISAPVLIQLVFINREIYDVISKMHWELSAQVICRELNHSGSCTGSWCVCHQYLLCLEFNKVSYHAEKRPSYKRTLFTLLMGLEMDGATSMPRRKSRTEIKRRTFSHSAQPYYTPKLQWDMDADTSASSKERDHLKTQWGYKFEERLGNFLTIHSELKVCLLFLKRRCL